MVLAEAGNAVSNTRLKQFGQQMLNATGAAEAKWLIDPMLTELCALIQLELHPPIFVDDGATITADGKAVSPTTAAQCAEDPERGRVFLQGVFAAISEQLQHKRTGDPVKLLYAGTGPLGWLILPLLPFFSARELQVTALDIHASSLESLRYLADYFGVSDRIVQWVCADATQWQPGSGTSFDIILSETMKHMLQQEPQVAVFTHLQAFLAPSGVLIPQQVKLSAELEWQAEGIQHLAPLGALLILNQENAAALARGDNHWLRGSLQLPEYEPGPVNLRLLTDIQVYQQHWLTENKCQLTLTQLKRNLLLQPATKLDFHYQQGAYPDVIFNFTESVITLADSDDLSAAGIFHLYRMWQKICQKKQKKAASQADEWWLDRAVLDLCGIGLEPGMQMLYQSNRLSDLIRAVEQLQLTDDDKHYINRRLIELRDGKQSQTLPSGLSEQVLSEEQLAFWQHNGYLVVPGVLSKAQCEDCCKVIWEYLQADPEVPASWYHSAERMQKIMLQLFRHPVLDRNRRQPQIRQIFEQLWQRTDLAMSTDRVSFNPPETAAWKFPGPDMHWDMLLQNPVSFGTQGLIYLTDTAEDQGAFCCVPGFHLKIEQWLQQQNKTEFELQKQNWSEWPVKPIAAKAGDLVIWHHALPHGASPNKAAFPRMVQYINMYPVAE